MPENSPQIEIARMSEPDLDGVIELGRHATQSTQFAVDSDVRGFYNKAELQRLAQRDDDVMLVAKDAAIIVGFSMGGIDAAYRKGYLYYLEVARGYKNRALEDRLLEETLTSFRNLGCIYAHVSIRVSDPTLSFFLKHGFHYGGSGRSEYPLERRLS